MLKAEREKNQAAQKEIIDLKAKNYQLNEKNNQLNSSFITNWTKLYSETKAKELAEQKLESLTNAMKDELDEGIEKAIQLRMEEFELETKGYSKGSSQEIKNWKLLGRKKTEIPNLTASKRRGVIKMLGVDFDRAGDEVGGQCNELVVFLVPFSSRLTLRTKINQSNLTEIDSHLQIEYSQGIAEETKQSNHKIIKAVIKNFLQSSVDNEWEWDIYVLINEKNVGKAKRNSVGHNSGTSADSALYLALTSAYLEIPLSDKVAITGTLELADLEQSLQDLKLANDNQSKQLEIERKIAKLKETPISQWKIKAIGGVGFKVASAVESGAKLIILPEENQDDYEQEVSEEVKAQIEKVIFIQKVADLDRFLRNQSINQAQSFSEPIQEQQFQSQQVQPLPSWYK